MSNKGSKSKKRSEEWKHRGRARRVSRGGEERKSRNLSIFIYA